MIAVGDLLIDVSIRGEPGHDARISLRAGGSAANVAVWAASLGAQASVAGRVGVDLGGDALLAALEARDVTVRGGRDPIAPTGSFVLHSGQRFIDRGANAGFLPEHLPARLDADIVFVSPYLEPETATAAVARATARWIVAHGRPLAGANAVVLNEEESGRFPEVTSGYELMAITRGAHGAEATLDGHHAEAAPPAVDAEETTGAGDAFAAGLLVSLARGASLEAALERACRYGAEAAASPTGWPMVK